MSGLEPDLDLPGYYHELGRLRMGVQIPVLEAGRPKLRDGEPVMRPGQLLRWRATSQDKGRIQAIARLYQGEVEPWTDAPEGEQWQVTTHANWIRVMVPPHAPLTQLYELWSGGGCQRRCTLRREPIKGDRCRCVEEMEHDQTGLNRGHCELTTRLAVILPDVPGLGVWRVESHGFFSGVELGGFVTRMLPWLKPFQELQLRIEARTRIVEGQTRRFVVAVIDSDQTMGELLAAATGHTLAAPPFPIAAIAAGADPDSGEQDPWYQDPTDDANHPPGWGAADTRTDTDDPWTDQGAPGSGEGPPPAGEAGQPRRGQPGAPGPAPPSGPGATTSPAARAGASRRQPPAEQEQP